MKNIILAIFLLFVSFTSYSQIEVLDNLEILENPFESELCEVWGTEAHPQTIGYPCVTDAKYYSKNFEVELGKTLQTITIIPDSLELRDSLVDNYGLRQSYHHYFWFDGDCTLQDNNNMPGISILNEFGNTVFYKNRNEFALNIEQDSLYIDNLNLMSGLYEIRVIHDQVHNLGWDFVFQCLEVDYFVGGYIWLFNSNIGNSNINPEVYISEIKLGLEDDIITNTNDPSNQTEDIKLFPNPSKSYFFIENNTDKRSIYTIISIAGKIVDIGEVNSGINKITINNKGAFFVEVNGKILKILII